MLLLADHVLPMSGAPIAPGAVRVENEKIAEVGTPEQLPARADEQVVSLGNCVLMPGLINAHCHLDYTELRGAIPPPDNFTGWIKNINALKRSFSNDDYLRAIKKGFDLLIDSGTTTVANIESFPELLPKLGPPPIRTWWFLELIDVRQRYHDEESLLGSLHFFEERADWLGGFGLSPHAPYTASVELYRMAKRCSEQYQMPFTTHVAESVQEQEMFVHARGELFNFMQGLGREMSDCGQGSALSHLLEYHLLTENCLAVHLNYLQDYDFDALAKSGVNVVHCPKSCAYFGHRPFEMERLRALGINISIGTDSLASNNSLDLRSELREVAGRYPKIKAEEWLKMVTVNAARALGQAGKLGEISSGAFADLVAFPMKEGKEPHQAVMESKEKPKWVMVNGRELVAATR